MHLEDKKHLFLLALCLTAVGRDEKQRRNAGEAPASASILEATWTSASTDASNNKDIVERRNASSSTYIVDSRDASSIKDLVDSRDASSSSKDIVDSRDASSSKDIVESRDASSSKDIVFL